MLNKSYILAGLAALALAGCTREVYLQPVPCEPECPGCPCFVGASECCPETAVQTVVTTYQVYDVPAPTVTYIPWRQWRPPLPHRLPRSPRRQ